MTRTDLRTQAAQHAGGDVERRSEGPTLAAQIQAMQSQFQMAMPRGFEATQLIRDAMTCLRQTPKLAECDARSVLGGLMTCSQLGLRPGVGALGHAWLLPFWDSRSRSHKAQLVIGYQGLVDLAHRSGRIASLIARTVYANDTFDVDYGLVDNLVHKPLLTGDRGEPVAYYAVAKFTGGGHAFLVMGRQEVEAHRDRYAMARDKAGGIVGPWRDQFEAMAWKTTVRQLARWLPRATELRTALAVDETIRWDTDPARDAIEASRHPVDVPGQVVGSDDDVSAEPDPDVEDPPGYDPQTGEVTS